MPRTASTTPQVPSNTGATLPPSQLSELLRALQAVQEARELRRRIDRGDDPMASRDAARAPVAPPEKRVTVADVIERFIVQHVEKLRRPENYIGPFRRLVIPAIGGFPIHEEGQPLVEGEAGALGLLQWVVQGAHHPEEAERFELGQGRMGQHGFVSSRFW